MNRDNTNKNDRMTGRPGGRRRLAVAVPLLLVLGSLSVAQVTAESTEGSGLEYAVKISAGGYHTCVLTSLGNVDCYGSNSHEQRIDYTNGDAMAVSAGEYNTCILTVLGNAKCYGYNLHGDEYNGGDGKDIFVGSNNMCILTVVGNVYCQGEGIPGDWSHRGGTVPQRGYEEGDAVDVSLGPAHMCILKADRSAECKGEYSDCPDYCYYRSVDFTVYNVVDISSEVFDTCHISTQVTPVECELKGKTGAVEDISGVKISSGNYHSCVLFSAGIVGCFGYDSDGQTDSFISLDAGEIAIDVDAGGYHTCVLTDRNNVHCYGNNDYGQSENWYSQADTILNKVESTSFEDVEDIILHYLAPCYGGETVDECTDNEGDYLEEQVDGAAELIGGDIVICGRPLVRDLLNNDLDGSAGRCNSPTEYERPARPDVDWDVSADCKPLPGPASGWEVVYVVTCWAWVDAEGTRYLDEEHTMGVCVWGGAGVVVDGQSYCEHVPTPSLCNSGEVGIVLDGEPTCMPIPETGSCSDGEVGVVLDGNAFCAPEPVVDWDADCSPSTLAAGAAVVTCWVWVDVNGNRVVDEEYSLGLCAAGHVGVVVNDIPTCQAMDQDQDGAPDVAEGLLCGAQDDNTDLDGRCDTPPNYEPATWWVNPWGLL